MNEQLQKALAEIIQQTMIGIDTAVSFLSGELPDVIHQLLIWYAVKNGILCFLGVLLLVTVFSAAVWGFKKAHTYEKSEGYCDGGAYFAWAIPTIIGGIVSLILSSNLINLTWLQIIIAPKIWLIEYAAKLVK